ncbi:primosomal protein DnaI [Neobacillus sp. MM2021_6]|uniref:primosomal protein DnaI n=1 Tax=Bacillaceae TaxID=186817 RepID=UPI00140C6F62|nr:MULTISPECIES: primosomal protein DnaI [Bacillaceae]MBO0960123.1 primosomal protein DnaI [Neobacillus sp. MM2021_6]NHC17533.1 primosomal protein DnaI [Bacillus sp. MM2020_4]WML40799.1 primosomal protein DnaI [Neobacillus sp. OS1-2]
MEKINKTLQRLASNQNFQKRYQEQRQKVLQNRGVQVFLSEHEDEITQEMIEKSMSKLYEYTNQSQDCNRCESLEKCINFMKGYEPELVLSRNSIDVVYKRCKLKVIADEKKKNEKLIKSLYVPRDILEATFEDFEGDTGRLDAGDKAATFLMNYEAGKKAKGLYLYGKFGVGKSYILGAIANELARKQISSMIVYVPELLREMKSSIADSTLNEKIEALKKEPILMLDDIGAEAMSSWTRDEILGPILQFRMLESLPTFFTSNFDFKGLEHHLTYSQRGEEEKMKAMRIMERIRTLSEPVLVDGRNRR